MLYEKQPVVSFSYTHPVIETIYVVMVKFIFSPDYGSINEIAGKL